MNTPWRILVPLVLILAVALSACSSPGTTADLNGTEWLLTSLNGSPPIDGVELTLSFDDGAITGSAGCNTYFGKYMQEGDGGLVIRDLANTEIGCLEPAGILEQEAEYLNALRSATGFRVDDGKLEVSAAEGALLIFGRQE